MDSLLASPFVKSFLAGSVSGTFSTVLFQPLDLIKTRLQMQTPAPVSNSSLTVHSHYKMLHVFESIIKNEKVTGLWKGFSPSFYRCVPGVGMYFSCLHALKSNSFCEGHVITPKESLLLGAVARTITAAAMLPFTVVKTRYECGAFQYKSVGFALKEIYLKEGRSGLYRGLLATLVRDAPFSGLYLMFYTQAKSTLLNEDMLQSRKGALHFACGIIAGVCASSITQPADVIKTSMQVKTNPDSIPKVALRIYRTDGLNGFFCGLVPRVLRRTLIAAMAWTVYEEIMHNLGLKT